MKQYKNLILTGAIALILGLVIGALFLGKHGDSATANSKKPELETKQQIWTCAMHPQIRQTEPGKCPICGMTLIPLADYGEANLDPNAIQMSSRAMKLADVQTTVVGAGHISKAMQLTGKVQEDERLVYSQTAHFPGRIEQLFVNFTGEYIKQGQKIASVYSPDLVTAQEELFEAIKSGNETLVTSAKKKLKLWKLSEEEINEIIASGKTMTEVPVRANVSGVVITKKVKLGDHVMEGGVLFEVADLKKLWVVFDAYESDLPWIKVGDSVAFTTPSVPGETFHTTVTFIDPIIDPTTRVAKVRTEINNSKGTLKPEMLVNGNLKTIADKQQTELTVPKSAVMWTGKRSIVYVKLVSTGSPAFMMREVTLGPETGDSYIISKGLTAGDEVVTNGTFTIDAAAQLQGKKSMMNPEGSAESKIPASPVAFQEQLTAVVNKYLGIKDALVASKPDEANKEAFAALEALKKVDMTLLEEDQHMQWMPLKNKLQSSLEVIQKASDLEAQRQAFIDLSMLIATAAQTFGTTDGTLYILRCPMADNNNGANWVSNSSEVMNPYFGEPMLKCGEVISKIE